MGWCARLGVVVLAILALPAGADDRRGFDSRRREREARLAAGGGGVRTEEAVKDGLAWLARHQGDDGSWSADAFADECKGTPCDGPGIADYRIGVTGLALLAFLGAGYTHLSRETTVDGTSCGEVVKKGFRYLLQQQGADGKIGIGPKYVYSHAVATLALVEEFGMTSSAIFKEPAQMAIGYLVGAQNPGRGWRYAARSGESDTSVTSWCVMALEEARVSGLEVPQKALDDAYAWIEGATEAKTNKVGYTSVENAGIKVVVAGKNEDYRNHEAMTAIGMLCRAEIKHDPKDEVVKAGLGILAADLPAWDPGRLGNDYYYWYYGTLAMFQADGPGSDGAHGAWKKWEEAVRNALVLHQRSEEDGCARGSWDADDRWGFEGGRVYATAMNTMTLEIYYRYPSAFEGK